MSFKARFAQLVCQTFQMEQTHRLQQASACDVYGMELYFQLILVMLEKSSTPSQNNRISAIEKTVKYIAREVSIRVVTYL